MPQKPSKNAKVRYAVVGLGWIAQEAVLPGFRNATKNSELVALVTDDPEKANKVGREYEVAQTVSYEGYDELLRSGSIDAVFVALQTTCMRTSQFELRARASTSCARNRWRRLLRSAKV